MIKITNDGKPCDGKLSRTVWGGGKLGDNIKRLPIVKNVYPATFFRGGIHLVQAGFVERKKKQLIPTKGGKNLVAVLPDTLTSPKLTAEWENALTEIAKGNADPDSFMRGIEAMAAGLVKDYAAVPEEKKKLFAPERKEIGKCPRCGSPVYEGKKNFYCDNRDCQFSMWKNDRFFTGKKKELTATVAAALLSKGRAAMKGLYSEKTGKTYDADVLLADTGEKYVNYKIQLKQTKKPKPKK